jgi:hypothetical protein
LLLRLADSGNGLSGHQFSKFPLSRRIAMIFNKPSKNTKKLIYALILPLIVISCMTFANRELKKSVKKSSKIIGKVNILDKNPIGINRENNEHKENVKTNLPVLKKDDLKNPREPYEIIQKIEAGNVRFPLSSTLVSGTDSTSQQKKPDMQKYLRDAMEMVRQGKYKEALDAYIWFHEHALEYNQGMSGVRLSFALSYWRSLADVYPPAMAALLELRDRKTKLILENEGHQNLFQDVTAINRTLGDNPKTINLFQTIAQAHPDVAKEDWRNIRSILFAAKRYDIIRDYVSNPMTEFSAIRVSYDRLIESSKDPRMAASAASIKRISENNLAEQSIQLIQFALYINDIKSAKEIQQVAMSIVEDYRLRDAIPADKKN